MLAGTKLLTALDHERRPMVVAFIMDRPDSPLTTACLRMQLAKEGIELGAM